jgi:hypothetical protein
MSINVRQFNDTHSSKDFGLKLYEHKTNIQAECVPLNAWLPFTLLRYKVLVYKI